MAKSHLEISNEFLIQRFGNGIQLLKPDNQINNTLTVAQLFKEPLNFWFCDTEYACVKTTEDCAEVCGMDSAHASIGKTAFDFLEKKQAIIATKHDLETMRTNKFSIIEFDLNRLDGSYYQSLTFKLPWFNDENKIIGTFGCGIVIGRHSLSQALSKLIELEFFNLNKYQKNKNDFYLSQRELQCLRLTIRGKSANQVAKQLKLSRRTVEEYLNNVKLKFNVSSKTELIDKAIDYFYELEK